VGEFDAPSATRGVRAGRLSTTAISRSRSVVTRPFLAFGLVNRAPVREVTLAYHVPLGLHTDVSITRTADQGLRKIGSALLGERPYTQTKP
jgi:hypothetical protein